MVALGLYLISLLLAWKVLCAFLRRRRGAVVARLDPVRHCHSINAHIAFVDFPFLSRVSLEFGLFRTYAIPAVSRVLLKAGHFAANASKRYDDTDILVKELTMHHVDSDRGSLALRRLNFIHSRYKIGNAEFLYVLTIFITMPREWCAKYGYRPLTELEAVALFNLWHDVGTRMGIRDIPTSYSAVMAYKEAFEREHMVYSDANHEIAELTMKLLLGQVPSCLSPVARRIAYAVMDDRLLKAMGFPKQSCWLVFLSHGLLKMHGYLVRWMPPRPLSWCEARIPAGCPASQGVGFDPDAMYKLSFQRYKPSFYTEGYKIKEVGAMKPGQLGEVSPGELLVPLAKCCNAPWPQPLLGKVM